MALSKKDYNLSLQYAGGYCYANRRQKYRTRVKKAMRKKNGLSGPQQEILREAGFTYKHLAEDEVATVIDTGFDAAVLDDEKLLEVLELTNILYRAG